jgi:hypothetical protein
VQVYWNRKYNCHHHYDPVTKQHWRCDRISNKEHDRRPSANDIRERRAMKRAARQEVELVIAAQLRDEDPYEHAPYRRSRQERWEMSRRRDRNQWEARRDYPFPYSRPGRASDVYWEQKQAQWAREHEVARLERELARVMNRLDSHPWDVMKLPGLKAQIEKARRAVV